jgi:hypothetical protein
VVNKIRTDRAKADSELRKAKDHNVELEGEIEMTEKRIKLIE